LLLDQLGPSNTIINDSSNEDGATPLHAAAMAGSVAAVQLLLARGANAGIAGCDGTQVCRQVVLGASGSERAGSAAAAVQLLLCAARMLGSHVVTEDLCVVKPTGPEGLMHKKLV
jgi:ankyrin repeat protein